MENMQQIINMITQQVIAALEQQQGACSPQSEGLEKVLVVGDSTLPVSESLIKNAVVFSVEDYETNRNILRYDRVVVTKLTSNQLADIAQGRTGDSVSCAVVYALLSGVDVIMLDNALSFRRFAGKGSTALYNLLEGYVQTIQVFGVKPFTPPPERNLPPAKPPKYAAPPVTVPKGSAQPNIGRLVTETDALELVKGNSTICLPPRAIVTPAARDVFAQAKVTVVQEK